MDRREEILSIAARLFREKGYTSTSLDEITAEMGVTKPAIYYYFAAKEDILYEICLTHIHNLAVRTQEINDSNHSIEEKVSLLCENVVLQYHNHRDVAEAYLRETAHLSLERRKHLSSLLKEQEAFIRRQIELGIEAGIFRAINSKQVMRGIGGMLNWLGNWYDPEGPDSIDAIAEVYVDFILHGLRAVPGSQ